MRKFLAIVRYEYRKIVLRWTFLVGTLLFPLLGLGFALVPALIFSIKGEPTRLVIVDNSGKIASRLRQNLTSEKMAARARKAAESGPGELTASQQDRMRRSAEQVETGFIFHEYDAAGKSPEMVKQELNALASLNEIDGYLIIPADVESNDAVYEYRSRKAGDFVAGAILKDALNEAVRSQRLVDANIDEQRLHNLSQNVDLETKSINERGEEKDTDSLFIASLVIGMMIYITLAIYGQVIMGAVVEEKETRIAEILFSSARPFQLMMGKLVGVALAGLTQLGIWVVSLTGLLAFLAMQADLQPVVGSLPRVTPLMVVYFLLFFLVGYFIYASMFALIGSMVTTVQEGGQFAFPPVMIMLVGFYFGFAVIRDPNSSLSFWVSIAPLFAPLTMPVRILAETPPFWQIALSLAINCLTIAALVWLAGRVYRVGMLMYGKRATIPEVLKWIRMG